MDLPHGEYKIRLIINVLDRSSLRDEFIGFPGTIQITKPEGNGVPDDERIALMSLYSDLRGASWRRNDNWGTGDPCIDGWFGIWCRKVDDGSFTGVKM